MWIRGMMIISAGLCIDFLQALFAWMFVTMGAGLQALTPAGGAVAGAAAGAAVCWNSAGGIISGIVDAVKCGVAGGLFGAAASAFGIPLGTALAFASSVCISITAGAGFILLLMMCRMFYPTYVWAVFIGETIPGLDIIPGWTLLAIRSVLKKNAEQGGGAGVASFASGIATAAFSPAGATGAFGNAVRGISAMKSSTRTMIQDGKDMQTADKSEMGQKIAAGRQQLAGDVASLARADITPHAKTA